MKHGLSSYGGRLFDRLEQGWEGSAGRRRSAFFLVIFFLGAVLLIEVNRQGWLPPFLSGLIPLNHLVAIEWAFTMLLILEVVGLTLALSKSVSISVGKQLEILSLILLRNTFKEISHLDEPLVWAQVEPALIPIVSSALGALTIFVALGFFYRIRKNYPLGSGQVVDKSRFILAKKNIAILLLGGFVAILFHEVWTYLHFGSPESVFEKFYTLLVFSDVLLVLISLRYSSGYLVAFRNSGFAVVTVLIRLALIAPPVTGALLGGGTAFFALGIIYAYGFFSAQVVAEQQPRITTP
jgi:hypothetical protein